ncbi:MAG: tandem-95 repeat protein, partial [Moraxellaceae bacterium]
MTDTNGNVTATTISIAVNPINDAPVITSQTITVVEDTPVSGQITATDLDGDALAYTVTTGATNGTVTLDPATGALVYTPNANYNGPDSFVVTVSDGQGGTTTSLISVGVTAANDAPAVTAQILSTPEDTPVTGKVAATDADGDVLTYSITTGSANGSVTIDAATGDFIYTPNPNYNGSDSFVVTVSDGQGGTTTSTISIGVTASNDAPTANGQTLNTAEDAPVNGQIVAADVDGDALAYSITTGAANGTVTLNPATGAFVYTPNSNYNGSDSFVVTVADGRGGVVTSTVNVGVGAVNNAPVTADQTFSTAEDTAVTGTVTATDVEGDTLSFAVTTTAANGTVTLNPATGAFVYTPNPNYNGSDSFVVTVSDSNGGTTTSTINVGVTPVDDLPVISSGTGNVIEDTASIASGTLTATDADNAALAFVPAIQSGAYGSLVLQANGQWTYSLDARAQALAAGATQSEVFTVSLNDGTTTTVTVGITGTDDAPVISVGTGAVVEDTAPTATGALTATDADNAALAFVSSTQSGAYGSLVLQANGQWTYSLD